MNTAPASLAGWLTSQCGVCVNPAINLGVEGQPKWIVLGRYDEAIGVAEDLKASQALIERYVAQQMRVDARAATEQFLETIDD